MLYKEYRFFWMLIYVRLCAGHLIQIYIYMTLWLSTHKNSEDLFIITSYLRELTGCLTDFPTNQLLPVKESFSKLPSLSNLVILFFHIASLYNPKWMTSFANIWGYKAPWKSASGFQEVDTPLPMHTLAHTITHRQACSSFTNTEVII